MEYDKNPFPKIDLFPRITRLCHFIFDHLQDAGLSDHNRGGGPALDAALYDQPAQPVYEQAQLDFESQANKGW